MGKSILFVCMGNICRSPAAEGVFQHLLQSSNSYDNIRVDSAGTIGHHTGHAADLRMQSAAKSRGYLLTSRARQVIAEDLKSFDLVIAMDRENFVYLQRLAVGVAKNVFMLSDFLGDNWPRDVPDPYYGGDDGFEYVLDMLEAACPQILKKLTE